MYRVENRDRVGRCGTVALLELRKEEEGREKGCTETEKMCTWNKEKESKGTSE